MGTGVTTDAKYKSLVDTLKSAILSGRYGLDRPIPSERMLIRRYGHSRITIQHALRELERLGLISRQQGRGTFITKQGANRKIGLIVPGVAYSEFFPPIVSAISRLAQMGNYTLIYGDMASVGSRNLTRFVRKMARKLIDERVAGIVCQPVGGLGDSDRVNKAVFAAFERARIPVVLIDYDCVKPPSRSSHDIVGINNFDAGRRLAEHLLSVGARKIHFVLHGNPAPTTLNRLSGVRMTVEAATARKDRHFVLEAEPDNLAALKRHLKAGRPDAFVCLNDADAAKLIQTLARVGLSVPRDVLVAGFNDVNIATLTNPPLTTIHQPCEQIAAAAFGRLLARIRNPDLPATEILLPAPLVVRASTVRQARGDG